MHKTNTSIGESAESENRELNIKLKKNKIINRELSWLSFNERVLQEACDTTVPVVERLRFLGIFSNNQDEFFKVRVATIKRIVDLGYSKKETGGESSKKLLSQITEKVISLQGIFWNAFQQIIKELEKEDIFLVNETQLNSEQSEWVESYFDDHVLPYLSPILLSNVNMFPYLKDKSIYLVVKLSSLNPKIKTEFALLEIPQLVSRIIQIPSSNQKKYLMFLDDIIRFNLKELFAIFNFDRFEAYTIKLTRDAELDIDNDLSKSFLEKIQQGVSDRQKGQPVRLVYDREMPKEMLSFIIKKLDFDKSDTVIAGTRYHNFRDFMGFVNIGSKSLEYPKTPAQQHPLIVKHHSFFKLVENRDIMLHFPYQKFDHFVDFLREAAMEPTVKSIKISLYRVSKNSKVVNALVNAARNGKKVTVIFELQARFDEKSNIYWTKKLEESGCEVLFGIKGLKIHAKLVHVSRKVNNKTIDYSVVSTGNFHEGNANVYTDVALFTTDKRITTEVKRVFEYCENPFWNYNYKYLLASPLYMRSKLFKLIDNEIANARHHKDAYIIVKINNLVDEKMVKKLYEANNAGVKIKLIVRGTCCIQTGIPGLSQNIEAISIVDKFLEHSRIFIFCNNNSELYYLSSADWMTRNLEHRVEVACPIFDPDIKKELRKILEIQLCDNVKARILNDLQDNQYLRNEAPPVRSQMTLYQYYKSLNNIV